MSRFNNGIVYTKENCIGCNKCIAQCGVTGSNIFVFDEEGKSVIQVDSKKCIKCGKCIKICPHNAREYKDDTEIFFADLKSGEEISLIVSPEFFINKERAYKLLGYLKKLGITKIYDNSLGAEISLWAHAVYLKDHQKDPFENKGFIAHECSAFNNIVELYYPEIAEKMIPVQSPLMCTTIYAKKYLSDTNKIAYLGSCISKADEISSPSTNNFVDYNITIKNLLAYLKNADLSDCYYEPDVKGNGFGQSLFIKNNFYIVMKLLFSSEINMKCFHGMNRENLEKLELYSKSTDFNSQLQFAYMSACPNGCFRGPGGDFSLPEDQFIAAIGTVENSTYKKFFDNSNPDENFKKVNDLFELFDKQDFYYKAEKRYHQPPVVPETVIQEIFATMLKDTEEKQTINCGICGHTTCREMAEAISCGYNKKENCNHYMNDKNHQENTKTETETVTVVDNKTEIINRQLRIMVEKAAVGLCLVHIRFDFDDASKLPLAKILKINKKMLDLTGLSYETVMSWTNPQLISEIQKIAGGDFYKRAFYSIVTNPSKDFIYELPEKNIKITLSVLQQKDSSSLVVATFNSLNEGQND